MYVRTVAAHAEDGRWSWTESGVVQPFEDAGRYKARGIRDRFDREMLVTYLASLEIRVDDAAFYGEGVAIRQVVTYPRRHENVARLKAHYGC